jgi:glutamate dehydrogenase
MNKDGSPRHKVIVEGANLFITPEARTVLERAGVILYKDASGQQGRRHVVVARGARRAHAHRRRGRRSTCRCPSRRRRRRKFYRELRQRRHRTSSRTTPRSSSPASGTRARARPGTPRHVLTDKRLRQDQQRLRLHHGLERSTTTSPSATPSCVKAIPPTLLNLLPLDTILQRLPDAYARALFGSFVASRYVYRNGLSTCPRPSSSRSSSKSLASTLTASKQ